MRAVNSRVAECRTRRLGSALLGLFIAGVGLADDGKPLDLLLTRSELRDFVRNYEIKSGVFLTAPVDDDEVIVVAPVWQAPMRDPSQDAWGGIAAPFWAIMHPKDAWRIFVPIPPKDRQKEAEPPAPDPR